MKFKDMQVFDESNINELDKFVQQGEKAVKKKDSIWFHAWQLKFLDTIKSTNRHSIASKSKWIREAITEKFINDSKKYGTLKKL